MAQDLQQNITDRLSKLEKDIADKTIANDNIKPPRENASPFDAPEA